MKDSEFIILKAFLFALSQQQNSLDENIVLELQAIASSLETRVMDLHYLALNHLNLKTPYQNARHWLTSRAAERGMGLEVLPAENNGEENSRELDNITRDTEKDIEEMEKILVTIDSQYNQVSQAASIFRAKNPLKAISQFINRSS